MNRMKELEEIRRIRSQFEMSLISKEEFNVRMGYLT